MAKTNQLTAAEAHSLVNAFDLEQDLDDIREHSDATYVSAVEKLLRMAGIEFDEADDDSDVAPIPVEPDISDLEDEPDGDD